MARSGRYRQMVEIQTLGNGHAPVDASVFEGPQPSR
jgi:hypothetical protein